MLIGDNTKHQACVNYLLKVGGGTLRTYSDGVHHDYTEIPEEVILQPTGENTGAITMGKIRGTVDE